MSEAKWLEDELSYQGDLSICEEIVNNFHKVGNVQEDKHKIVVFDISTLIITATRQVLDGLMGLSGLDKAMKQLGDWWQNKLWKK